MTKQPKRLQHPYLIATLAALLAIYAGVAHAQQASPPARRVAVATRTLARGTVLTAADFVVRDTSIRGATAIDTTVGEGWVTRRLIGAGEILRMPSVERPRAILANQAVELEWQDRNVSLTLRGTATRDAALGERIPVRTDSGRRVDATVIGPGRLRLE